MEHGQNLTTMDLQTLKSVFEAGLESGEWEEMSVVLEQVAAIGETQGRRELSIRAQSLQVLVGGPGSGQGLGVGARMQDLFNDLFFQLSHLQWRNQTSQ